MKIKRTFFEKKLKTFSVNNTWTCFIVLLFSDPHSLKSRQRSQNGTTNPDGVFPFWWRDNFDFHGGWSQSSDFFLHSISNTWVHSGTTGQNVVSVQIFSDINIALHNRVISSFMNTSRFHTDEGWLKQSFWASESFVTNGDNLTIWKFIRFFQRGRRSGGGHFLFKVQGNVAKFFFDVSDDFSFSGSDKAVTSFSKDFHEVISQVSTGKIESHDSVWESITFVNWNVVGNTITRVQNDTSGSTRSVQRQNGLNGDVHGWEIESLKHNLSHLFSIGFWVQWSFGQQSWAFFWGDSKFVVVSVVPDFFHIVPIGDDTVFDWVFQGEDTSFGLGFVSDIRVFLAHTDHNTLMSWSTDDGWEDGSWSIVTGETAFAKSGSVIDNQVGGFSFVVGRHGSIWVWFLCVSKMTM